MKRLKLTPNKIFPYVMGLVLILLLTMLSNIAAEIFIPSSLVAIYLLMVVVASLWWQRGPAIMVSILGALALDFFIIPPYLKFTMNDGKYFLTFAGVSAVGLIINTLASQTRQQAVEAKEREEKITLLYRFSKDLASANSLDNVLDAIRRNVAEIFEGYVAVFLPTEQSVEAVSWDTEFPLNEREKAFARWVFENESSAGMGTNMFKESQARYIPLKTASKVWGVLGISFKRSYLKEDLLNAVASQAAVALQRAKQEEITRQLALMHDREKLQTALLNSISHDLRTPLVSVKGALSSLLENSSALTEETRRELLTAAYEDADHLNRIVGNLLDITRLEAGALKLHMKPCEVRDVIGAALQSLKDKIDQRSIVMRIPNDLPEVPMDFVLMMRVFVNLVDNALKYSQDPNPIVIAVSSQPKCVRIDVTDKGCGIPESDLVRIFDKFYRAAHGGRSIAGTGLGLSICKGIVEVHGGQIDAVNNADGGATLSVTLPLERVNV